MRAGTALILKVPGGVREVVLDNLDFTCRAGEGGARRSVNIRIGTMTRDTVAVSFSVNCSVAPDVAFTQDGLVKVALADGVRVLSEGESPAWSPDGERIAFTKGGRIALMASDGSGLVTIDQEMTTNAGVAWSPDRSWLAFGTTTCDEWDNCTLGGIFLIRTDGSGRQQIPAPDNLFQAWDFAWSPDGTTLAFTCLVRSGGYHDVCVIRTDGSGFRIVTTQHAEDDSFSNPSWNPDGSELVFGVDGEYTQLVFARPDGSGQRRVANWAVAAVSPVWSPDGDWILFASTWGLPGLHIIRPDGSGMRTVFPGLASSPSWRP
jgi:Tol biopolymer transport system component